jgi:hypothetical protein
MDAALMTRYLTAHRRILAVVAAVAVLAALLASLLTRGQGAPSAVPQTSAPLSLQASVRTGIAAYVPPIHHVFVINIENEDEDNTWGDASRAPYLAKTLRAKGVLLDNYYGTAHNSEPNSIAQISGQGPNASMQFDCQTFSDFQQVASASQGQAVGTVGCVFPKSVKTIADQIAAKGRSWRGYMDGMAAPCQHPAIGSVDTTQKATKRSQYATRHDPFMYFHSIIDRPGYCRAHVVNLNRLTRDLRTVRTTRNLTYITPDLCDDGHDATCVDRRRKGGLAGVDAFMKTWVPRILSSPAYRRNGMLIITADESDGPTSDSSACCGETSTNVPQAGLAGPGGGAVGALVISPWTQGGTWSTTPYNHYALLASLEEIFRLPKLGYAGAPGLDRFGLDVYNDGWWRTPPKRG